MNEEMRWIASEDGTIWDLRWAAFERTAAGIFGIERRIYLKSPYEAYERGYGASGRNAGQRTGEDRDTRNAPNENDESEYTRSVAYTRFCPL
jgi:hypothetical protein